MSQIPINSHDFLAKLGIIKSYLSLFIENKNLSLDEKHQKYLETAYIANQELIDQIKKISTQKP